MSESPNMSQSAAQTVLNVTVSDIAQDTLLCVLIGEVDLLTAPLLRERLSDSLGVVPRHLVIDLSEVQFLASTGLRILLELRATQRDAGRRLALVVGGNRMVTRPLQLTGLDHNFDLHVELATAVRACRAGSESPDGLTSVK